MIGRRRILVALVALGLYGTASAQIDVEHVISIGRNALYFNDYIVSIGYFNRAIDARPWMAEPYLYRSIAKISLDDYQGAIEDASLSIDRNPYLSRAYVVRGIAHQNLGHRTEAIADYRQGLLLAPDHAGMRYNLVVALLADKQLDEAERASEEVIRYAPRNKEIYALRAGIALERQDTLLAENRIAEAIARDSMMSLPYRLRAGIAAERKQWQVGIESLTKAIGLETPASPELYANRGIMHYQANNLRGAMADYSSALELDPKNKISLHNRALLRQFVGERTQAIGDWDKLIELEPKNYIARYNRAMLTAETGGSLARALADLDLVLAQYPSFVEGFVQRSLLRKRLGDTKGAERDYWHAWDLQQDKAYQARARAQAMDNKAKTRNDQDLSIDKYNLLVEASSSAIPTQARYSSELRGRVQDRQVQIQPRAPFYLTYFTVVDAEGKPEHAGTYFSPLIEAYNGQTGLALGLQSTPITLSEVQVAALGKELEREPQTAVAYLRRGIAYSLMQDYEHAIADFTRSIDLDAKLSLTYFARALATMRYRQAENDRSTTLQESGLEAALRRGQSSGVVQPPLPAQALRPIDALPGALQDLNRLLDLAPNFAYGYYNRAWLYTQSSEREKALADYTKALELHPRLAEAYYNRGLILLALGRTKEGVADLSRAGELGIYQAYSLIKQMNR